MGLGEISEIAEGQMDRTWIKGQFLQWVSGMGKSQEIKDEILTRSLQKLGEQWGMVEGEWDSRVSCKNLKKNMLE